MAHYGTTNVAKFLRERGLKSVCRWIKQEQCNVTVGTLKLFCKTFDVDPNELEQKCIVLSPRFYPVDMSSQSFIKLKTHVLNEGRVSLHIKIVGILSYINQDPVLLKYFADTVREAGGAIKEELTFEGNGLVAHANPVLARALDASGLQYGRKTRTNPSLDPLLGQNPNFFRYHIQATLTEEGWCTLTINKSRRACFDIAWGRSVDITNKLSEEQRENIRQLVKERRRRKIPVRIIGGPEAWNIIQQNPPRSFIQEIGLLTVAHKDIRWPGGYPTRIHLSKKDRITAFWEIHFTRPDLIDLIHDEYSMLPSTWKVRRFENLYEAYTKYRGRRLTDEDIQAIGKVKDDNPPEISVEWVSEKVRELFPDAQQARDIEKIKKILGRSEKE